jgi:2-keto-4-pentenoate hydratase/2-oxohepta-3-ene-1,7-dioic acid hydratase in catechol pathway
MRTTGDIELLQVRGATSSLPFGRVLVAGAPRHCRLDGETVRLLDRPAYAPGASATGTVALADVRVLAPVEPTKIVAVGLNYRAHADELAMDVKAEPILFVKPPSAVIGPGDAIVLPAASRQVEYEAELVLVVGRRCRDLEPATAPGAVAGYTCGNDVTARDLQKRDGQWTRAKSFDTFCPLGPWVVPAAPPASARVSTALDGVVVQEGTVGDMIVPALDLLVFVSGIMTLEAGDVLMTGTPPGVGPLRGGQTVTVSVDEFGALTNTVA